ncbi:TIGR01212 family radical SAM protein [Listeria booriae]|uniref:TIGR01212 family radical SAM protein n=1 Tax=Listeria booriae TaxID=1552123 RepID=UPI0016249FC0|nr:TIGR01212 family radical SAM protein [Listeria booriae]MBC1291964.1 TIGR01212 family radical SAM protein [Listeria booriae]MBC1945480.1 TIGR01212 family radical SAM protein [Listeria booriae]MBC6127527.1 TIGR01212 family radical SAM protein [Listeria booriae]MBC6163886.1 TIGR01212 family radical SAM protein [Listeria booriae]MBC6167941.1 TIGR01212 family radical SAM protein [Listeria booriae]
MNPFPYSNDNKRYHTWNYCLRDHFGYKVFKVALDGGFDCPNRDGTVAHGGCTFCSAAGSGDFAGDRVDDLQTQFQTIKEKMHTKWKDGKYMAYFQAFTNTHAPVAELREKYESVLNEPGVVGLSIATRPDCLPDDVVDYLAELNDRIYLWVELGLQSAHNETGVLINRAHDYDCYVEGVAKLHARGIRVCTHIINGLPRETPEMMIQTVQKVVESGVAGIKIHLLHLLKGTPMVQQYQNGELKFLTKDDYVSLVCDQLEILPPEMVIHRITGDGAIDDLIGPIWSLNKWEVLNSIDAELVRRDSWQGKFYNTAKVGEQA